MTRLRQNFLAGTTTNDPLTDAGTTLSSAELAGLQDVSGGDIAVIVLDPTGTPEIVHVTAHTFSETDSTVLRGQEGTAAVEHAMGTTWKHVPTVDDFDDVGGNALVVKVWDTDEYVWPGALEGDDEAPVILFIGPSDPATATGGRDSDNDAWIDTDEEPVPVTVTIEEVTGTTYTAVADDSGKIKRATDASLVTVTLPAGLAVGTVIEFFADGAAGLTFDDDGSSTIEGGGSVAEGSSASAVVMETDRWVVIGAVS